MNASRWTSVPSLAVAILLTAALVDCGGGSESEQCQGPDVVAADAFDVGADEQAADVNHAGKDIGPDDDERGPCITDRVCAADTDCNQGERCNGTLTTPTCQILYCAGKGTPCDHAFGDVLCVPGLACIGTDKPTCQPCQCDDEDPLTLDTCKATTGDCEHERFAFHDPATGLTWQDPPKEGPVNFLTNPVDYAGAEEECANLTLGGWAWRLPTIDELRSLVAGCAATESGGTCGVTDDCLSDTNCHPDSCTGCDDGKGPAHGCYWNPDLNGICWRTWSASVQKTSSGLTLAGFVNFQTGAVSATEVHGTNGVRCVRVEP